MKITKNDAIQLLKTGQVVALPTETVYGLAACIDQPEAIENIFKIKGRPLNNPLIIHVSDSQCVKEYSLNDIPKFDELTAAFWPGPLTLILPVHAHKIPTLVRANLDTAAFRVPHHLDTLEIIQQTGPLVMPSANLSGKPSATMADHVEKDFGKSFPVVDGGNCQQGLESTILHYLDSQWVILRLGALTAETLESVLGYQPKYFITTEQQIRPLSPGQLLRHYAPKAKLILGDNTLKETAPFILGFTEKTYSKNSQVFFLGSVKNPGQVANNLYHLLRELDVNQVNWAWVDMDFPDDGLWKVIRERLLKASSASK